MISLTLSQVRLSVAGSCARYFQKLFTSSTRRVRLMSSNTARTLGEASRYSIGPWALIIPLLANKPGSPATLARIGAPHHRRDIRAGARHPHAPLPAGAAQPVEMTAIRLPIGNHDREHQRTHSFPGD